MGLYHNAGPLPWDDDVDVVMTEEDALELIALVESKKAFPFLDEKYNRDTSFSGGSNLFCDSNLS